MCLSEQVHFYCTCRGQRILTNYTWPTTSQTNDTASSSFQISALILRNARILIPEI